MDNKANDNANEVGGASVAAQVSEPDEFLLGAPKSSAGGGDSVDEFLTPLTASESVQPAKDEAGSASTTAPASSGGHFSLDDLLSDDDLPPIFGGAGTKKVSPPIGAEVKVSSATTPPASSTSSGIIRTTAQASASKVVASPVASGRSAVSGSDAASATPSSPQKNSTSQSASPETPLSPEHEKTLGELDVLTKIVDSLEFLSYLKPRIKRIRNAGCDPHDLIGLYRMASQVMLENLQRQTEIMQRNKAEYDKQLRHLEEEMLFAQSSALVTGKKGQNLGRGSQNSYASSRLAEAAQAAAQVSAQAYGAGAQDGSQSTSATKASERSSVDSETSESAALEAMRKQMAFKDDLLLKARMAEEDAEKRCEKMANDVANIRARAEKDLKLKSQRAKESLFSRLLPVMDSFDGALRAKDTLATLEGAIKGLEQIHTQLLDCCAGEGLEIIKAEGEPFDPNFHEAMGHVTTSELPEDYVFDELRRGYLLDGKLLRAAMVRLSKADPNAPTAAPTPAAEPAPAAAPTPAAEPAPAAAPTPAAEPAPTAAPTPAAEPASAATPAPLV
ncbi:MAG: nucleotide exchange factor GrpE [bacterium]|nr:nucleotide exchange factor GrpE [bacterium]